jgi:hypothetical protein
VVATAVILIIASVVVLLDSIVEVRNTLRARREHLTPEEALRRLRHVRSPGVLV